MPSKSSCATIINFLNIEYSITVNCKYEQLIFRHRLRHQRRFVDIPNRERTILSFRAAANRNRRRFGRRRCGKRDRNLTARFAARRPRTRLARRRARAKRFGIADQISNRARQPGRAFLLRTTKHNAAPTDEKQRSGRHLVFRFGFGEGITRDRSTFQRFPRNRAFVLSQRNALARRRFRQCARCDGADAGGKRRPAQFF